MKKFTKNSTAWRLFLIRKRYQEKRHRAKWKNRKKNKKRDKKHHILTVKKHKSAPYVDHVAPENFSFINNTNEVLDYFDKAKKIFYGKENVNFDIANVSKLTPDTIALLVASLNNPKFVKTGNSRGNAPKAEDLHKIFTESGFGEHIAQSTGFKKSQPGNLLHKEVNQKVVPRMAKNACLIGLEHVFNNSNIFSPLYEILIECMSNTHNHASLHMQGECKWWLYVYNNPKTKTTSYSFIDLGVGIFKSVYIKKYLQILKITGIYQNADLIDDLLAGKIHSRIEKDRELRGKGIPQIVRHSKESCFKSFYIITNNVKIDLTNSVKETLKYNFEGTFLHWELINK